MRHIEFLDIEHFENNYRRVRPQGALEKFVDFFWQTKFESLWEIYPDGFSDALFPNIGYTYLINIGSPITMRICDEAFSVKENSFLPRHNSIECHHNPGCLIFGVKFKVSPVAIEKKINFSEYRDGMVPLSYLIDKDVVKSVKEDISFEERVLIMQNYFEKILNNYDGSLRPVNVVTEIIDSCKHSFGFKTSVHDLAAKYEISTRTLQRYFEQTTSLSTKQTLQIMRVRAAAQMMVSGDSEFNFEEYGYYDYSHFYKHLRQFLDKSILPGVHRQLVRQARR